MTEGQLSSDRLLSDDFESRYKQTMTQASERPNMPFSQEQFHEPRATSYLLTINPSSPPLLTCIKQKRPHTLHLLKIGKRNVTFNLKTNNHFTLNFLFKKMRHTLKRKKKNMHTKFDNSTRIHFLNQDILLTPKHIKFQEVGSAFSYIWHKMATTRPKK